MAPRKSKNVLLVDDDSKFTTLLKSALQSENVEAVVAPTAADATVELTQNYDLIILDGELPDMNGPQWLEQNRSKAPKTPVMFISASWRDTESHNKLINELGVNCVVHKPVSLEVLVDETLRLVRSDAKPVEGFEKKLSELSVQYAAELAGEFKRIFDIVRYARLDQIQRYDLEGALSAAHKIHGTGAIYGFEEVSRIAGLIEAELKELMQERNITDQRRAKLVSLLQKASEEVNHISVTSNIKHTQLKSEQEYYDRVAQTGAKRVLMVDDDVFFLKRLEYLLAAEGILRNSYSDSQHIMKAIENFNADLLVLDVNMPGADGFQICKEVRKVATEVPIIIVSADSSPETHKRAIDSGASRFEPKPIKNMHFVATIKELIKA
jgi:DNA-binding response OmpR family regulator